MVRNFGALCKASWSEKKFLCVGLDSDHRKLPTSIRAESLDDALVSFNQSIVEATAGIALAYKLNLAFYLACGNDGVSALRRTIAEIHRIAPGTVAILDGKFGDIGNTNEAYARFAFELCKADAVTVNPYLGIHELGAFLSHKGKGIFMLCRTSNESGAEFQDLPLMVPDDTLERFEKQRRGPMVPGEFLHFYKYVAYRAATEPDHNRLGLVVGATFPAELAGVRRIAPETPFLIPGVGFQTHSKEPVEVTVRKVVEAGRNKRGGMFINASRSIIFASNGPDFAEAAGREAKILDRYIKLALKGKPSA